MCDMSIVFFENWNAFESLSVSEGYPAVTYVPTTTESFYSGGSVNISVNGGLKHWMANTGHSNAEKSLLVPCLYQQYNLTHATTTPSPQTAWCNTGGRLQD